MKKVLFVVMLIALSLFVAACATPPSDVPSADVAGEDVAGANNAAAPEDAVGEVEVDEEAEMTSRDGEYPINKETSSFEFEGYAVGKSHVGTFDVWAGTLIYTDGELSGIRGSIEAASVNTGIKKLDGHLQSEDFFEVETYPEIVIDFTEVGSDSISGDLTFRGVTKKITFPAEVGEDSVKTDFLIDTESFGINYIGANSEVRIGFEFYPEG